MTKIEYCDILNKTMKVNPDLLTENLTLKNKAEDMYYVSGIITTAIINKSHRILNELYAHDFFTSFIIFVLCVPVQL